MVEMYKLNMEIETRERERAAACKQYMESEPEVRWSVPLQRWVDIDSDTDDDEVKEIAQEEEEAIVDIYGPELDENISNTDLGEFAELKFRGWQGFVDRWM